MLFSIRTYIRACRLEKRVIVPLPVAEAREQMIRKNLSGRASNDLNYAGVICFIINVQRFL